MAMAATATGVLFGNASSFCFPKTNLSATKRPSSVNLKTNATATSELGFLTSQLAGIRISSPNSLQFAAPSTSMPAFRPIVARRICPFTGKKSNKANKVTFSNHKTRKWQFVNLQYKRMWWAGGNRWVKLRLSTKAIKTIEKNGLDAVAKKAGIDLRKL